MHEPRPYGLHGEIRGEDDGAAVEALVRRLTNYKSAAGLDSAKMVRALPSGDVAIALDMGGILKVVVQGPPKEPPPEELEPLGTAIPMLFSGVITKSVVAQGEGVGMDLSLWTRRRIAGYGPQSEARVARAQQLQRFAIDYSDLHAEFRPEASSFLFTQYAQLRPTWFSGLMAAVVGIVGGYGRQDLRSLPDNEVERATLKLPAALRDRIEREIAGRVLPGYLGRPPQNGQIQFDYKFARTHGVGKDSDGKPWLLRVDTRGVYAMPLPVVPGTGTAAFRQYIERVGDPELLWVLDTFGAMPSGESFPSQIEDFEAWRRAGVIIKVCGAADFYGQLAYSSAIGWSFDLRGSSGYNTCYEFGADGIQRGYGYKLSLSLSPAQSGGVLTPSIDLEDPQEVARLNSYLAAVSEALGSGPQGQAALYKIRRTPAADILARASAGASPAMEAIYWQNLELSSIAVHTGSISRVASGKLWAPGPPRTHPQIKFPEPVAKGCLSHDFGRLEGSPVPVPPPRCDTVMFGYYVGDDLRVVKYFRDDRQHVQDVDNNYEDCMAVGSWEQTATQGSTSILGNFYLSELDERKSAAPVTTTTRIVGTDLGYDSQPYFAFDHFFSMVGTLWRNRYFLRKTHSEKTQGYSLVVAVCIPFLDRNAVLHAKKEAQVAGVVIDSQEVGAVRDPNSYRYFTYDFVWAWVGGSTQGNMATATKAAPSPKDGNPVWVMGYNYDPVPCSDFADQGDWIGGLPADYTWLIHPIKSEWRNNGGGGPPTVRTYSKTVNEGAKESGALQASLIEQLQVVHKDVPQIGYFRMSPDPDSGDVFYVDAVSNVAGTSVYASVSESDPQAPKYRKHWGYTALADHKSAHHFIGVLNE